MIVPPRSRSPWQRLYAAAHRRRAAYWGPRAERLPVPVWSVGNLHWGGTGKTPVVAALAAWLRDRGVAVAVLSRGYGRRGGEPLVVSRGAGPLVPADRSGDEPWLLADQLPGVPVAVAARRADAGRLLLASLDPAPALFLLDDGFSHLALARDLDLLVLPEDDPFGGGRLLPSGRLREPLAAAARAHALVLTGPGAAPDAARAAAAVLAGHGFAGAAFACTMTVAAPRRVDLGDGALSGPVLLVTGVARPERVRQAAESAGLAIGDHLAFADHHDYPPRSVQLVVDAARRTGATAVLTTTKDRVKLAGRLPRSPELSLWELPLIATPEPAFWEWLATRLPRSSP